MITRVLVLVGLFAWSALAQYAPSASGSTTAAGEINGKVNHQEASGAPSGVNCTQGKDIYTNSANGLFYGCTATGTPGTLLPFVMAATSATATQALFATTTAGAPAFRAIVSGDIPTLNQSTSGNAATATALAANGTNCSAGSFPLGVDASGNSESCTVAALSFTGDGTFLSNSGSTGAVTATLATAAAHKYWGNDTGSTAAPGYKTIGAADLPTTLTSGTTIPSAALTVTPTAPTQTAGDNSTAIATDAFVTTAIANAVAGINPVVAVQAATAAALPNSPTYSNGASGVGATLTAGSNAALVIDGYTAPANNRVLVKNQASAFQNGVYTVTQAGSGVLPYILTRVSDFNTPAEMNNSGAVPVDNNGTVNALTSWLMTSTVTTVGTDSITFTQFTLNPNNNVVAVSPGVGLCHFAGSTQTCTSSAVVNADVTSIDAATKLTGIAPVANGGTGISSAWSRSAWIAAAGCNNATAGNSWDLPTSSAPTATCYGTSYRFGALDYADSANTTATFSLIIPTGWTGAIDFAARAFMNATSQSVKMTVATVCVATSEDILNPTFNSAQTITVTSPGTANQQFEFSQTGVTTTGCAAGELIIFKVGRDTTDTSTTTFSVMGAGVNLRITPQA